MPHPWPYPHGCGGFCSLHNRPGASLLLPIRKRLLCVIVISLVMIILQSPVQLPAAEADTTAETPSSTDVLPIFSYDSNTGVGGGIKSFFLNHFGKDESFDAVLFASSNGERWYRLVASIPDFELRQARIYPVALDVSFDYDIQNNYSFFGIGNQSGYHDRLYYTREAADVSLMLSRGFTTHAVGQIGLHLKSVKNSDFPPGSPLGGNAVDANNHDFRFLSILLSFRYDSRTSFINPSEGMVLQGDVEKSISSDQDFGRLQGCVQTYTPVIGNRFVLACRSTLQTLICNNPPVQLLLPIGGGTTVRGYVQDRFLDRISALLNFETRFLLYRRLSGVIGYDVGKVWHELKELDVKSWAGNPITGIRFMFDTFIVRLDFGFSSENTGIYLNFGQLF
jgi:outer membrane protein assembly factor BamA